MAELVRAIKARDLKRFLRALREQPNLNTRDHEGKTPLHLAAKKGHLSIVRLLLRYRALVDMVNNDGDSPLDMATLYRREQVAKVLLEKGARVNEQMLFRWCNYSSKDIVSQLISREVNINATDERGDTPLQRYVSSGKLDMVRLLLEHGADPNLRNNEGKAPIHTVCNWGGADPAKVQLLLEYGADVNAKTLEDGTTPLHYASCLGNGAIVRLLMKHGADPNAQDIYGYTALHKVKRINTLKTFKLLLYYRLDISLQDNTGKTPMDSLTNYRRKKALQYMAKLERRRQRVITCFLSASQQIYSK